MSIEDGMKQVDKILMKPRPEHALSELVDAARQKAKKDAVRYRWDACETGYSPETPNHEIDVWNLSLMYAQYLAGLLALKAAEGHCQTMSHLPCKTMANAHMYMFNAFKSSLESLVKEMSELEQRVKDKTENYTKLGPEIAKELGLRDG
jgi:hypothetical protein